MSSCKEPTHCFFCIMNEPNPSLRRAKLSHFFNKTLINLNPQNDTTIVLTLTTLYTLASQQPNDPEFPSLGIINSMSKIIQKALNDAAWLFTSQNIYVAYYAAHVIGSYAAWTTSRHVAPLVELLRGKLTWVEKRVAIRALSRVARSERGFAAVLGFCGSQPEVVVGPAVEMAMTCVAEVYDEFVGVEEGERVRYHCDLMTHGLGGYEEENATAEKWACEGKCWSLDLLTSFALREIGLDFMCEREGFLEGLCCSCSCGVSLVRALCGTKSGRDCVALTGQRSRVLVEGLCYVARSWGDCQMVAIECVLVLLRDPQTRVEVIESGVLGLGDLVELGKGRVGETIARVLLRDYHRVKYGDLRLSERVEKGLSEIWDLKVDRRRRERLMSEDEIAKKSFVVGQLKKEGNSRFWSGNVEEAAEKYSEGLRLCPLKMRKERVVLYSNRAQCRLVVGDADGAISDATRALSLSGRPHGMSLWRRAQAFDMKGLARESLMDCMAFVKWRIKRGGSGAHVPHYAVRMIDKQMNATWIFAGVAGARRSRVKESNGYRRDVNLKTNFTSHRCESTIIEPLIGKRQRRKKVQMADGRWKKEHRHCHVSTLTTRELKFHKVII